MPIRSGEFLHRGRIAVGHTGERTAEEYLRSIGYRIFGRNVRIGRGEIDLIAYDPSEKVIVFVEVKTRSKNDPDFRPEINLTIEKKRRMQRAAQMWISAREFTGGYRIDALCVAGRKVVEHFRQIEFTTE
ncbi:MAG TPA: YraN family protein [Candidatus Peribacteraceae bacterium]|nr:YraN family protein [Candidatus Peribacteraceae bacterium]